MPQPLLIDAEADPAAGRPAAIRYLADGLVFVSVAVLFYFILLSFRSQGLFFPSVGMNVVAFVALVALPALAGMLIVARPVAYKLSAGETILARRSYFTNLARDWWKLVTLWPALILGIFVVGRNLVGMRSSWEQGGPPFTSVLFTIVICFVLALFYFSIFFTRHELRVSDEGIRIGLPYFVEWSNIDHVARHGTVMHVFHKLAGRAPVTTFARDDDPAMTAVLDGFLNEHNVAVVDERPRAGGVRVLAILLSLLILAAGVGLYLGNFLGGRWAVATTFVAGVFAEKLIERLRGMHKITRIRPMVTRRPLPPASLIEPTAAGQENPDLLEAMETLAAADTPENQREFQLRLLEAKLIIPAYVKRVEDDAAPAPDESPDLEFMMAQGLNGNAVLPAFTDIDAMHAWIPRGSSCTLLTGGEIARWVIEHDTPAIVLNPASALSRELTREQLEEIVKAPAVDQSRPAPVTPPASGVTVRRRS